MSHCCMMKYDFLNVAGSPDFEHPTGDLLGALNLNLKAIISPLIPTLCRLATMTSNFSRKIKKQAVSKESLHL